KRRIGYLHGRLGEHGAGVGTDRAARRLCPSPGQRGTHGTRSQGRPVSALFAGASRRGGCRRGDRRPAKHRCRTGRQSHARSEGDPRLAHGRTARDGTQLNMRHDGRKQDELRAIKIKRGYTRPTPGSVLFQAGRTTVLCTASLENRVPPWMVGEGRGWVTAEYNMLPGSTSPRKARDRNKVDGRTP